MKSLIKKIVPKNLILAYHYLVAVIATIFYGFPSRKMIVVGVTGTKGKTSTANFIWSVLEKSGIKTGILSTANIRIGEKEMLNPFHMTMPGRFKVQKILRKMNNEGCKCVVIETTSQGIEQWRHIGIWYDILVFTNLFPEHIDSHGSFENYKKAKGKLFKYLGNFTTKKIDGKPIEKTIVANIDNEHSDYYLNFPAKRKITFSTRDDSDYKAQNILSTKSGVCFEISNNKFSLSIQGEFNVYNAIPAIIIGNIFACKVDTIQIGLESIKVIPGRMEEIIEGQNYKIFVDYAHEKQSMTKALETARQIVGSNKVIVLLGAEGGGRDKAKRPIMGEIAGKLADRVIISNVDPYDDDPIEIAEDIAKAAEKVGKKRNQNLFVILDRREGIRKALSLANQNDLVIITGKGAEQSMVIGGRSIPWDDRKVVRAEIKNCK